MNDQSLLTWKEIKGSIGLSLFEIKKIMAGEANEKTVISGKIKETDSLLSDMKEMLGDKKKSIGVVELSEPDIRPFPRTVCLYVDENIDLEKLGISVGKLYEKASKLGVEFQGSHFVRYDKLNDEAAFSMKTCLPVSDCKSEEAIEVREKNCLHVNFKDGFSKVGNAHVLIKDYAESHNMKLADRAYEVYNKDMSVDVYYPV